jgi:ribose-phosphate pyrophosphokinase
MAELLNLVNPNDKLSVNYKISRFPDGQQTIDLIDENPLFRNYSKTIKIKSRLNNFKDLELIICATQALRNVGVEKIELYIPYIIGGRSDRKFQEGGINYLKQVVGPIINSQNFSKVTVMDSHSDVTESVLNNFEKLNNFNLVKWSLPKIDNKNGAQDRVVLVSPDAGAFKKIYDVAKKFEIENIITATKIRDLKTGKILHTNVPVDPYDVGKSFVIIDDICDGGRTFIEIAKSIRENEKLSSVTTEQSKIYLIVTHSIFSAGLEELTKHFDKIFTTNSVLDLNEGEHVDIYKNYLHKVEQLNVF